MGIEVEPIGYVQAVRPHAEDDFWGGEQARLELVPQFAPQAGDGRVPAAHSGAATGVVARAHA
jgi:tRNA (adenine37-N6)-methyltransferase